jgi:hypothetical protein
MRRTVTGLLIGLLASVAVGALGVLPASAHICTYAAQIAVGRTQTISVGITVEGQPVTDFAVTLPAALHIDRIDPAPGFHITHAGQTIRYQGGPVPAYTCLYVTLGVTASEQGVFIVPQIQRTADGTVVARMGFSPPPDATKMQLVYAGVKPPSSPSSGGSSTPVLVYAGIALVALALGMLVFFGVRAWRSRYEYEDEEDQDERDEELDARVARFKKQTRDRVGKP